MILASNTQLFVVTLATGELWFTDLNGFHLALVGGTKWEDVRVFLDRAEANQCARACKAAAEAARLIRQMSPSAAEAFLAQIQGPA